MRMRYLWLMALATGVLLVAIPTLAALTVETPVPSVGSGMYTTEVSGPTIAPTGGILPLNPALDAPAIECNNFDTAIAYTGGFVFIPPDPHDSVGQAHVLNVSNVIIEWRPKTGTVDTPQYQNSLKGFFSTLVGTLGTECFDPKTVYDQYNNRFIVVALERRLILTGDPADASRILVAVSKTSDPNAGWWFFAINSLLTISGASYWADFPGLALDDKAIYITANMFGAAAPNPYGGTRLWIINKVPTYAGPDNNIAFAVYNPFSVAGSVATTAMPTHMWGPLPLGTGGQPLGTYLVSYSGLAAAGVEAIEIIEVADPLAGGGGPFFTLNIVSVGNMDSGAAQNDALQLGSATRRLETNDRRAQNAVWRTGQLFTAANCMPAAGVEVGEATAHWWRFNCPGAAVAITLGDQGNAGAEDLGVNTWTWFPNVQVDCNLNMAIGFAASNAGIYGGAYYATRMFADAPGTTGPTCLLAAGVATYIRTFTSSTTATSRWGDYSGLAICPVDEATFWVYNEYAGTQGTPTTVGTVTENGRWQTKLGKFHLKQPVSVAITSFDAIAKNGAVSLSAAFRSNLGIQSVAVYRGGATGDVRRIETVFTSGESFTYTDKSVRPGETYTYQIGVRDPDGEFLSPVERVTVASLTASLAQNSPNPFNPTTTISFTLPAREQVTVSIYDASGKLVRNLVNDVRDYGTHRVTWDGRDDAGSTVGSGVYFYRLSAGKHTESKKMVMLK